MTIDTDIEVARRPASPLRHLHDTATSLEKLRIGIGNRVSAIERGVDEQETPVPSIYAEVLDGIKAIEDRIDAAIERELKNWPVYDQWLRHVRGIGPALSGQMLALLLPPIPEKGPSSWYKAAGLTPEQRSDGQMRLPRPRAGEGKIDYHPWLRRCLYNVATSLVRNGAYYREVYDREKSGLQQKHAGDENWSPLRLDRTARWAMVKLFLSHLWEAWCAAEGIHNRGPYGLVVLADGTRVIRENLPGGAYRDHAFAGRPLPDGSGRKL